MRVTDKAPMGGGGGRGACGGYPSLLSSCGLTIQTIGTIINVLTYWRFNMDKVKSFIGSLIFMVPMLVLMLAYFDVLVP